MGKTPDRFWIADMARGDAADRETVFNRLWESYRPRLAFYLAAAFGPCGPEAEDLIQEIFIKVFEKLDTYNPLYSFPTWLFTIARNHCLDAARKRSPIASADGAETPDVRRPGPEESLLLSEKKNRVRAWLDSLPKAERGLCYLRFIEGLNYRQLARVLGKPPGTLKFQVHGLKKKLRQFWEETDEKRN